MTITRRMFLMRIGALSLLAASGKSRARAASGGQAHSNIVIILADDMGYSDLGCFGGEIETPNLDRLAANGVRFTQAYSAARCCPTRASLLTGLYPHQTGIGHMTNEADRRFDYGYPAYKGELNRRCVTLAEVLRPAGYHAYMAGKWHVGTAEGLRPLDRGFERYYGIVRGACNYFQPGDDKLLMLDRTHITEVGEDYYTTDAFTDYAIRFVEEQEDEAPFLLYLAFNAPHWPLNARPEDVKKYRERYHGGWDALREERFARQQQMGLAKGSWNLTPRDEEVPAWEDVTDKRKEELAFRMALYAAQVDRMDQNVGRLLYVLEKQDKLDNTLILFLSDNGGCAEGGKWGGGPAEQLGTREGYFLTYGQGWANASNTPFRLYKHWVHEGGIASPMIAHWPAAMPKERRGGFCRAPVHLIDIMTTAVSVSGAQYPERYKDETIQPMEGASLEPLLRGGTEPVHDAIYWEHEGNRAVRRGKWKLASAHARGDKEWHLFDLSADRSETRDLVNEHPEVVKELSALYDAWAERCGVLPWPVKTRA